MKIKVSETTDQQLDWLVALCTGAMNHDPILRIPEGFKQHQARYPLYCYTLYPNQGLPIIEREGIHLDGPSRSVGGKTWYATHPASMTIGSGQTILIAGLRCYVISHLGDEVELPEELRG